MEMKKIIKVVFIIALIPLLAAAFIGPAGALNPPPPPNGVPTTDLPTMINQISSVILILIGVIAVLFLIIGGFQYITAAGNPDQVQKAKMTIMYSIIGIGVAVLSFVIVQFVLNALR